MPNEFVPMANHVRVSCGLKRPVLVPAYGLGPLALVFIGVAVPSGPYQYAPNGARVSCLELLGNGLRA